MLPNKTKVSNAYPKKGLRLTDVFDDDKDNEDEDELNLERLRQKPKKKKFDLSKDLLGWEEQSEGYPPSKASRTKPTGTSNESF